ncbi:MAG: hypothetical protein K8T10_13580 [Candidatus Eremiobacteraeota bacterium]|nr:hypothetical protein [Candidatus Eremiobacteraeota bacterium]
MKHLLCNNINTKSRFRYSSLILITLVLLLLSSFHKPAYAQAQSPTKAARVFFQSMGYMNYKRSWQYMSSLSQKHNLIYLKRYFLAKRKDHTIYGLRFQVETNVNGYRNLLFSDLFSRLTIKMGVKASSFKSAKVAYVSGNAKTATIRLTVEGKKSFFKMVKEEDGWKVVFYNE